MCLPFNPQKREGFCQLLQQMKNKHSEQPEPDMITIFIGTWNMGRSGRLPLSPPLGHRFLPPPPHPRMGGATSDAPTPGPPAQLFLENPTLFLRRWVRGRSPRTPRASLV